MTLADLTIGESGIIESLNLDGVLRQRLLDLGLVPGTQIKALFSSRRGDPVAYKVRGTVLALRHSTARNVVIRSLGRSDTCPQPIS